MNKTKYYNVYLFNYWQYYPKKFTKKGSSNCFNKNIITTTADIDRSLKKLAIKEFIPAPIISKKAENILLIEFKVTLIKNKVYIGKC